jgi:hypothetical protein
MIYRANVVCKMELCWPWKLFFFFFFLGCYAAFELGIIIIIIIIIIMSGLYPMNSTWFVTLSFIRSLHMECALQNRPKITAFLWLCQYVNLFIFWFFVFVFFPVHKFSLQSMYYYNWLFPSSLWTHARAIFFFFLFFSFFFPFFF